MDTRLSVIYQRDGSLRAVLSSLHWMANVTTRIERLINTYPQMKRTTQPSFVSNAPGDCPQGNDLRQRSRMKRRPHMALAMMLFALTMAKSGPSFADRIVDSSRWHNAQQYDHVSRSDLRDSRSVHGRANDWRDFPTGEKKYFVYGLLRRDGIARLDEALSPLKVKVIARGCVTGTSEYALDMKHNARIEKALNVSISDYLRRHAK